MAQAESQVACAGEIEYSSRSKPTVADLVDFYRRQGSVISNDRRKIQSMIDESYCFVTARLKGKVIGLARGITDGARGRLVECKLDPAFQGPACITRTDGRIEHDTSGIARRMAQEVLDAFQSGGVERVDVVAHGTEVDFCEELGFRRIRGAVALEWVPATANSGAGAVT